MRLATATLAAFLLIASPAFAASGEAGPPTTTTIAPQSSTTTTTAPPASTVPPPTTTTSPTTPTTTAPPASSVANSPEHSSNFEAPDSSAPTVVGPSAQSDVGVNAGVGVSAFVRGADNALWWRQLTANGWSSWQSFGNFLTTNPAAITTTDGSVYVFVRGGDGALWVQNYNGSQWSGWFSLGGFMMSQPVPVRDGAGLSVFIRGGDDALYRITLATPGGQFSDWSNAGGRLTARPAVTQDAAGIHVFVRGTDLGMYEQIFNGPGAGTGYAPLGGLATSDPVAASDGTAAMFVRGGDNGLYRYRSGTWLALGGGLTSTPAVASTGSAIDVFVRGGDLGLYTQRVTAAGGQGWQGLGGALLDDPGASSDGTITTVFVHGTDNNLYVRRSNGSWGTSSYQLLGGVPVTSAPAALDSPEILAAPPAPGVGLGFDACAAKPLSTMQTWRLASPYTSVGIYIGGENRGCAQPNLTPAWFQGIVAQGWKAIATWVGPQAPCSSSTDSTQLANDSFGALLHGFQEANRAADAALALGLPGNSAIYYDMESYARTGSCRDANNVPVDSTQIVRSFTNGWVQQLNSRGYFAGVYSSLCSGIVDLAGSYSDPTMHTPQAVWIAAWNGTPNLFGFSGSCAVSDDLWPFHQRIHQYVGGHNETWGGVTINIDTDVVDGPLAPH